MKGAVGVKGKKARLITSNTSGKYISQSSFSSAQCIRLLIGLRLSHTNKISSPLALYIFISLCWAFLAVALIIVLQTFVDEYQDRF